MTVEALGRRAVEDRIFLGQADLGIGVTARQRDGIRTEILTSARYLCALPPAHRFAAKDCVQVSDLAGERFIGPMHDAGALWNGIDAALVSVGVEPMRMLECQQSMPTYAYVAAGLGVSIVEPISARLFRQVGVLTRPLEPAISLDFTFIEPDTGPTPSGTGVDELCLPEHLRPQLLVFGCC